MTRENEVKPSNFIYPLFCHTKDYNEPILSMPGCDRHSEASVLKEVGEAIAEGVSNVILFPKIPEDVKTNAADECYNPNGLIPSLISKIKDKYGGKVNVWTDVALDPYSDQGHDGMVSADKRGDGGRVGPQHYCTHERFRLGYYGVLLYLSGSLFMTRCSQLCLVK
jgi:porphobilinogen synthase